MDRALEHIRPWVPAIGRFLLVVTFLEDAHRMIFQWDRQLRYLSRNGLYDEVAEAFLVINIVLQIVCSVMAIAKFKVPVAVGGLFLVLISQFFAYRLFNNLAYALTCLSLAGGLLLLIASTSPASASSPAGQRSSYLPGLPQLDQEERGMFLQLFGRIMVVLLYFSLVLNGDMTPLRLAMAVGGLVLCALVIVGFQTRSSALALLLMLLLANIVMNNWWTLRAAASRDFAKYEFFQALSVAGGLLLLISEGPGSLSMDQRKKRA